MKDNAQLCTFANLFLKKHLLITNINTLIISSKPYK